MQMSLSERYANHPRGGLFLMAAADKGPIGVAESRMRFRRRLDTPLS